MKKYLELDLEDFQNEYFSSSYDLLFDSNKIVILEKNKEKFIKEFLETLEARVRENLVEVDEHE